MKKEEVELVIIKIAVENEEAFHMKIYKNGTVCRTGAGGLPSLNTGMMSFVGDGRYFDPLLEKIPQDVLDQPVTYEEEEAPHGFMEFMVAFFGDSQNGLTGERADWAKSTGVRIKMDQQSKYRHPIMGFVDNLAMDAAELTNELYFDVIMHTKWKAKSSTLPERTLIHAPKSEAEIHTDYDHYVNQMTFSARKWNLNKFAKGKTYEINGAEHIAFINHTEESFQISFLPLGKEEAAHDSTPKESGAPTAKPEEAPVKKKKKPWWKF